MSVGDRHRPNSRAIRERAGKSTQFAWPVGRQFFGASTGFIVYDTHGAVSFPKRGGQLYTHRIVVYRPYATKGYLKLSRVDVRVRVVPPSTIISDRHSMLEPDPMWTGPPRSSDAKYLISSIASQYLRGTRGETRGGRVLLMSWVMKIWAWRRGTSVSVASKGGGLTFRCRTRTEEEHGWM